MRFDKDGAQQGFCHTSSVGFSLAPSPHKAVFPCITLGFALFVSLLRIRLLSGPSIMASCSSLKPPRTKRSEKDVTLRTDVKSWRPEKSSL